jgi:hypothetical protein
MTGLALRADRLRTVEGQATGLVVGREGAEDLLELPREEVLAAFREHGVLVFRGFPVDAAVFDAFTRVMGLMWRQGRLLQVERRPPQPTATGKILHLQVLNRPGPPRGKRGGSRVTASPDLASAARR